MIYMTKLQHYPAEGTGGLLSLPYMAQCSAMVVKLVRIFVLPLTSFVKQATWSTVIISCNTTRGCAEVVSATVVVIMTLSPMTVSLLGAAPESNMHVIAKRPLEREALASKQHGKSK